MASWLRVSIPSIRVKNWVICFCGIVDLVFVFQSPLYGSKTYFFSYISSGYYVSIPSIRVKNGNLIMENVLRAIGFNPLYTGQKLARLAVRCALECSFNPLYTGQKHGGAANVSVGDTAAFQSPLYGSKTVVKIF